MPIGGRSARAGLLLGLGLLFYLAYEHTQWLPRPGAGAQPLALVPVPADVWYTGAWLVLGGGLWLLLRPRPGGGAPSRGTFARRAAVATVTLAYAVEAGTWFASGRASGLLAGFGAPTLAGLAAGAILAAALALWRPPRAGILLALLVAGGLGLRALALAFFGTDANYADNLASLQLSLERFTAGSTPYAIHDYGTHVNPMGYLPWTFLAYLPAHVVGIDIRVTNVVLSLALLLALWALLRALPLAPASRTALALVAAALYALPVGVGEDAQAEWQVFDLALVATFGLIALERLRPAAVAYGVALGAMPVALFCAVPLFVWALRARGRGAVQLALVAAAVAGAPALAFLAWDAGAFVGAVTHAPLAFTAQLASGQTNWPYLLLWHRALGGWLPLVQLAVLALVFWLARARLRTTHGLISLAIASYLALTLTAPYVAEYMLSVVLPLALVAEAVRASAAALEPAREDDVRRAVPSVAAAR